MVMDTSAAGWMKYLGVLRGLPLDDLQVQH